MKHIVRKELYAASLAALTILLCLWLFDRYANVVMFADADNIARTSTGIQADISGYKVRNCRLVRGSSVGYVRMEDHWREAPFRIVDGFGPTSKPRSLSVPFRFGRGEWVAFGPITQVMVTVGHDCTSPDVVRVDGDFRTTKIGPFKVL